MVVLFSHDGVAVLIHCESVGLMVELRNVPFSASMAPSASARQSGHMALWCDLADTMVARVSHNHIAVAIHCESTETVELSNGPFSVSMTYYAGSACQSGHKALWCDLADTIVARVSHDDIAIPIRCDSTRISEP
jgi:hypothetical protein